MKGRILRYSVDGTGVISGDDGQRYQFAAADWHMADYPTAGMYVDFDVQDGKASDFVLLASTGVGQKNRLVAAIFSFFGGALGIHKFYLGYTGVGIIYLVLTITIIGVLISWPLAWLDGIIYLTKSDEDFNRTYVEGSKAWF